MDELLFQEELHLDTLGEEFFAFMGEAGFQMRAL
jgi:hypothetical protein